MDAHVLSSGIPDVCKWCGENNSAVVFENANLCNECHEKAIRAVKNPRLCRVCSVLLTDKEVIQGLFSEDGYGHSVAWDLRNESENGCGLCRMFLLQDPNNDSGRLQFVPLFLTALRPKGVEVKDAFDFSSAGDINAFYFSSEPDQFSLELSISAEKDNPAAKYVSQRPPEEDLGNEETNQQIRTWLDECLTTHPKPFSRGGLEPLPKPLPTRVIDVGSVSTPQEKLFQPSAATYEQYVTLSYTWGRDRFLTTTLDTVERHKESLDWTLLPQTFKDAIQTTRNLGFRYLWIDALCIIQDSADDIANEIDKMGDIYNNSSLTIAVVSATRVAEGFLKPKPQISVEIPYRCPDGAMGLVRVSPQRTVDLWQESLFTRAWCLQENFLSSRLLLYTGTEVIWQCESAPIRRPDTTHVSYLRGDPNLGRSPFRRLPPNILAAAQKGRELEDGLADAERYEIWRSLVENYTRRRLTVASDRLPALSGIAQKFKEAWADEYYAGHWKRQFIPLLSWRRSNLAGQGYYPPLSEYRAPSWSWASIDGPIEFDFRFDLGNARGLGAKLVSCVFDMGSREKDFAVLEASMIRARDIPDPDDASRGIVFLDDHKEDTWPRFSDRLTHLNEEMMGLTWCMLLGEGKSGSGKMMKTVGLLIMEVEDPPGAFSRIGLYESYVKGTSKLWVGPEKRRTVKII